MFFICIIFPVCDCDSILGLVLRKAVRSSQQWWLPFPMVPTVAGCCLCSLVCSLLLLNCDKSSECVCVCVLASDSQTVPCFSLHFFFTFASYKWLLLFFFQMSWELETDIAVQKKVTDSHQCQLSSCQSSSHFIMLNIGCFLCWSEVRVYVHRK